MSAETLNREETFYSYACKLYLDHALYGTIDQKLINGSKISVNNGSTTTTVYISRIEYDDTDQTLILYYASDIKRTNRFIEFVEQRNPKLAPLARQRIMEFSITEAARILNESRKTYIYWKNK